MDDLLKLTGVCKSYKRGDSSVRVLVDVKLRMGVREIGAVLGSRGQGKTTLLQIAAGLLAPDRGEVWLGDVELTRCSDDERARVLRHEIAWIHREGTGLDLKVLDYVALPLWTGGRWPLISYRRGKREAEHAARLALERVGAEACAGLRWGDLSNWDRVLVAFARGIARGPRLMVVDDVIDGFGMTKTREAGELLLSFAQKSGCAILMSVSDIEAAQVAERVWGFEHGGLTLLRGQADDAEAEIVELHGDARQRRGSRGTAS
jgi:ABC-type lipoprotein export system ATPase subunit